MSKLDELLKKCENDKDNVTYKDGSRRFEKQIEWIRQMFLDYSEKLGIPVDELVDIAESKRDYWWPNYYQECNFPPLDSESIVGIFRTAEEFRKYAKEHWDGFKCPRCGAVSQNPQECIHRVNKDGKCDWAAYGLFRGPTTVIVLEIGLSAIPIFDPVAK